MEALDQQLIIEPISARELEILQLIEVGMSNREIDSQLYLSNETIKWHNKQLFSKLGAQSNSCGRSSQGYRPLCN